MKGSVKVNFVLLINLSKKLITSVTGVKTNNNYDVRIIRNQSINSKENNWTALFTTYLSHLIKRLSLTKRLNLLTSTAKMSKLLKSMGQSHSKRWLETVDDLAFLALFSVKFETPIC